jgi:E3 ubiquitin-protein ligase Topors
MEAERHSHLRSRSPSGVRLLQTQAEVPTDARDQVHGKRKSEMKEDAVLEIETTTKIQPATNKKRLRPSRNVGILQAVQAHLGSSSSAKPNGPGRQKQVDVGPSDPATVDEFGDKTDVAVGNCPARILEPSSSAEAKPLLLARLSEQRPKSSLSGIDTADTRPQRPTEDVDAEGSKSTLSAPEIMARTRARLAKLKNEPVAGVLPAVSAEVKGHDDAKGGGTQASSGDDIRARLLNRLEEEKRQIPSPGLDSLYPTLPAADTSRTLKAALDPQTAEAKLRKQAQVRVRLAAAKRAAGDPSQR